ncbi:hypothetical protein NM208_g16015 [Fusarium decemcellulare]|uniref:Uncharacterized protein n=1 Tax=Fusarium decemcellulare TaxID=57161 RepID=A0ACC1RBF6_9HYPO|nr:hypothetical protein NM208_g16015 [Fusarium decemcellulare]
MIRLLTSMLEAITDQCLLTDFNIRSQPALHVIQCRQDTAHGEYPSSPTRAKEVEHLPSLLARLRFRTWVDVMSFKLNGLADRVA